MLLYELLPLNKEITRREAAKTVHEYIREELKENDEEDISSAAVLKDLYDCGVCVNHIAQVYLKGIMAPLGDDRFGNDILLSENEKETIIKRIENPKLRVKPMRKESAVMKISLEEICSLSGPAIIDVRTNREYENGHFEGSVNIPLSKYVLNPYVIGNDKYTDYVFICEQGANALIAANCAVKHGFINVYFSSYN